jgi:hypothetical protein
MAVLAVVEMVVITLLLDQQPQVKLTQEVVEVVIPQGPLLLQPQVAVLES